MVVDGVAHIHTHVHDAVAIFLGQNIFLLLLELNHPRGEVLKFPRDFVNYIVHDRMQFILVTVIELAHVVLLVVFALLGPLLSKLSIVLATLLVAV